MYTVPNKANKQIAKFLGLPTKAGIKFVPGAFFRNGRHLNKRETFQATNQPLRLPDTSVATLIKAKSTENTNLNSFFASDAKVGGWVGLNL